MGNLTCWLVVHPGMRRSTVLALGLLLVACKALAGLSYRFESITTGGLTGAKLHGTVEAEAQSVRINVETGDQLLFRKGTVLLSSDGGQTLHVVDPASRSYYTLTLRDVLGAGTEGGLANLVDLKVSNAKAAVGPARAAEAIEGYPTRKSHVSTGYDLTVDMMGQKMTMRLTSETDVWTTDKLPAAFANVLQQRGIRTGIPEVDRVLGAQTRIGGFPLKQVTTTRVRQGSGEIRTTTTARVTKIRAANHAPSRFVVPAGFARVASPVEKLLQGVK